MDEFDQLLEIENSLLVKGKEEGLEVGKQLGYKDGHVTGFTKGCEIGKEIGFYFGNALVWGKLLEKYPDLFSERAKKTVAKLSHLISTYALDVGNEKILEQLDSIRKTYKLASSQMHSIYKSDDKLSF